MFTPEQNKHLSAMLHPDHVKGRTQGGSQVSYVEGWHVIAEANRIFGFEGWDRRTVSMSPAFQPIDGKNSQGNPQWTAAFVAQVEVTVRAGDRIITRQGTGFGGGQAKALADAVEKAVKEAETDAMKRAFMTFGNPFGLALYDKLKSSVGIEEAPPPPPKPASFAKYAKTIPVTMTADGKEADWGAWSDTMIEKIAAIGSAAWPLDKKTGAMDAFLAANKAATDTCPKDVWKPINEAIKKATAPTEADMLAA